MTDRLKEQLKFLSEIDKMKSIFRQTMLTDMSRYETDAEHSWHFALMSLVLFEYAGIEAINIDRVVRMALVHDLVEIYAGDTFAYDVSGNEDKLAREEKAADKLFSMLPTEQAGEYRLLWKEFDAMETSDAKYANAIDRLQPFLNNYLTEAHTWTAHKVSVEQIYKRMDPVKTALPELWEFVEYVIEDSIAKHYISRATDMER